MAKETMRYEEAVRQLESIVAEMESGEPDIDSLCGQLKKAQKLMRMCKDRLAKTDEEVKKILAEK